MNTKLMKRSGTGIKKPNIGVEKSGTGIEKSGTGLKSTLTLRAVLIVLLLWVSGAAAGEAGASSFESGLSPEVTVNDDLVVVNFRDGYRITGGYGHIENGYAQVSIYSLEYVHILSLDSDSGDVGLSSYGQGTGSASPETDSETAPTNGQGTGTSSAGNAGEQLKAWGIAEVVLSERGIADIIVYRLDDEGVLEEVGVYSGVEVH